MIPTHTFFLGLLMGIALASLLDYLVEITSRDLPIFKHYPPCPGCQRPLGIISQIPIVGFIIMLGKCPRCGAKRARSILFLELTLVSFSVWAFTNLGMNMAIQVSLLMVALMGVAVVDLKKWIIPNYFVLIIMIVGLLEILSGTGGLVHAIAGLGVAAIVSLLLVIPQRFGSGDKTLALGDVKLCLAVGLWLGWVLSVYVFFIASLLAFLTWLISGFFKGFSIQRRLQFGPFVALSTMLFGIGRAMDPHFVTHLLTFRF